MTHSPFKPLLAFSILALTACNPLDKGTSVPDDHHPGVEVNTSTACTEDVLNSVECVTAASRYVTAIAGASVVGANGFLGVTLPLGFYDGTTTVTAQDSNLLAANIKSGVTLFGVTGSLSSSSPACTDDGLNAGACTTATNRYVTASAGSNVTSWSNGLASTTVSAALPTGFYTSKSCSFTDSNLTAGNIKAGTSLFGVTGSLTAAYSACSDDTLNASQCSTATNRYVTSTAGTDITVWSNGTGSTTVTAALPTGFYTSKSCSFSDANLTAANIKSGTSLFGVTGSLAAAYAACTDNALNAGKCSTATSRYVTSTAGADVTVSGTTSATIPAGFQDGTKKCLVSDASLLATNIVSGNTILGVAGTFTSGTIIGSTMFKTKGTAQLTSLAETTTYAGTNALPAGYRVVPTIATDNSSTGNGIVVSRTGWSTTTCGTTQATTALRIADCATVFGASATWDGRVNGPGGQGVWKLVSRSGAVVSSKGQEVWQDQRTGLLWSSRVSNSTNWCKLTGSNFITGNPFAENDPSDYCDNATYQNTSGLAISACYEDGGTYFTRTDASIDPAGLSGLSLTSTPAVAWRAPTADDYKLADVNGIRFVLPDLGTEISATPNTFVYQYIQFVGGNGGAYAGVQRNTLGIARCVGR